MCLKRTFSSHESKVRKGKKNLLNIDKVDKGIADVALVLEIDAKVEKVKFAEMGLVDALQQHFLTKKKKEKDHISQLPQRKNSAGDLHVDIPVCTCWECFES